MKKTNYTDFRYSLIKSTDPNFDAVQVVYKCGDEQIVRFVFVKKQNGVNSIEQAKKIIQKDMEKGKLAKHAYKSHKKLKIALVSALAATTLACGGLFTWKLLESGSVQKIVVASAEDVINEINIIASASGTCSLEDLNRIQNYYNNLSQSEKEKVTNYADFEKEQRLYAANSSEVGRFESKANELLSPGKIDKVTNTEIGEANELKNRSDAIIRKRNDSALKNKFIDASAKLNNVESAYNSDYLKVLEFYNDTQKLDPTTCKIDDIEYLGDLNEDCIVIKSNRAGDNDIATKVEEAQEKYNAASQALAMDRITFGMLMDKIKLLDPNKCNATIIEETKRYLTEAIKIAARRDGADHEMMNQVAECENLIRSAEQSYNADKVQFESYCAIIEANIGDGTRCNDEMIENATNANTTAAAIAETREEDEWKDKVEEFEERILLAKEHLKNDERKAGEFIARVDELIAMEEQTTGLRPDDKIHTEPLLKSYDSDILPIYTRRLESNPTLANAIAEAKDKLDELDNTIKEDRDFMWYLYTEEYAHLIRSKDTCTVEEVAQFETDIAKGKALYDQTTGREGWYDFYDTAINFCDELLTELKELIEADSDAAKEIFDGVEALFTTNPLSQDDITNARNKYNDTESERVKKMADASCLEEYGATIPTKIEQIQSDFEEGTELNVEFNGLSNDPATYDTPAKRFKVLSLIQLYDEALENNPVIAHSVSEENQTKIETLRAGITSEKFICNSVLNGEDIDGESVEEIDDLDYGRGSQATITQGGAMGSHIMTIDAETTAEIKNNYSLIKLAAYVGEKEGDNPQLSIYSSYSGGDRRIGGIALTRGEWVVAGDGEIDTGMIDEGASLKIYVSNSTGTTVKITNIFGVPKE